MDHLLHHLHHYRARRDRREQPLPPPLPWFYHTFCETANSSRLSGAREGMAQERGVCCAPRTDRHAGTGRGKGGKGVLKDGGDGGGVVVKVRG